MARKFLTAVDLQKNELQNARVQNLAAAPSSPVAGQIYYDTVANKLFWWNGTSWVDATGGSGVSFGAVTAETTFGGSASNGVATSTARSDHAHGNPVHDAAAHSAIPISALAVPGADVPWNSKKITGLLDGSAAQDAATVGQVTALVNTGTNKTSVRAASTANVTVASALTNGSSMDGVTLATGDRVLLKNQTTASENGIYTVVASGAAPRATDADISAEVRGGLSVWVNEGTTQGDTRWVLTTNDPITLGSTSLVFTQDFAANATNAGAGLTATGNVLAVGAGTGISVATDSVAIDTTITARWKVLTTTGGATSEVITHSLGNQWVLVQVANGSSPFDIQDLDIELTSTTTVTLRSSANLPAGLKVTVVG